jgi:hypothetical protein
MRGLRRVGETGVEEPDEEIALFMGSKTTAK